ncbi:MAG: glycosyl hydrolase family 28-related protein [Polyangiaceae bacterium]|nr:glycosyl hydrolase family 28-related protein [Polyangiaceae bacterium]
MRLPSLNTTAPAATNTFGSIHLRPRLLQVARTLVKLTSAAFLLHSSSCVGKKAPQATPQVSHEAPPPPRPSEIIFPEDAGQLDLKRDFGALGDGVTDDTAKFQKAVRENSDHLDSTTLYLAGGTYLVSDTIQWFCRLSLVGRSQGATIIKLKDNAPGFGDPNNPRPVISVGDPPNNGDAMQSYVSNLIVDTGKGNPGAIGIAFQSNNGGGIEDVTIRSGDTRGHAGLTTWPWPGPALIKNLRVEGFDRGIYTSASEYDLTFVNITLIGQKLFGWENDGLPIEIENLQSYNSVPAFKGDGTVVMINSHFHGGDSKRVGMFYNGDSLYMRNVVADGYSAVLQDSGGANEIKELWKGTIHSKFPSPRSSLNLPIKETPSAPHPPIQTWTNVRDFNPEGSDNWTKAIQAAIDSGTETLYFPRGAYNIDAPLHIRGNVKRIIGMRSSLKIPKSFRDVPMVRFEGTSPNPLIVEYFNAASEEYRFNTLTFHQAGTQPIVFKRCYGSISNEPNKADVFLEDFQGILRLKGPINVWSRSLNIETEGDMPELVNDGGTLWLLGYKTEYQSTNIFNRGGAKTEMLGGLIYPVTEQWPDIPSFINEESSLSMIFAYRVYVERANQNVIVKETRGGVVRELSKTEAFGRGAWSLNYTGFQR